MSPGLPCQHGQSGLETVVGLLTLSGNRKIHFYLSDSTCALKVSPRKSLPFEQEAEERSLESPRFSKEDNFHVLDLPANIM